MYGEASIDPAGCRGSRVYAVRDSEGDGMSDPQPKSVVGRDVAQVRGVLAEKVIISTPLDPFLSLKALADYSGISVRKLREHLEDPARPLPCYRIGVKLLVRRSEFDGWIAAYRTVGRDDVGQIVSEVLKGLKIA